MPTAQSSAGPFSVSVQILECERCGGPITSMPQGGRVTCSYCDAVHQVVGRTELELAPIASTPEAREDWVRAELAHPHRVSRFDPDANWLPDLAEFQGKRWSPRQFRAKPLAAFRSAWTKSIANVRDGVRDDQSLFRVYWLADKLAHVHEFLARAAKLEGDGAVEEHELLRWRASLETALGLLTGTDYEYIIRCELARAAAKTGAVRAATDWLATVDPTPDSVDLDSEWRLARATIAAAEHDAQTILDLLGTDSATIPVTGERNLRTAAALRIHGFEMLGRNAQAKAAYAAACSEIGVGKMWSELSILGYAPRFHAQHKRQMSRVRTVALFAVIGAIAYALSLAL